MMAGRAAHKSFTNNEVEMGYGIWDMGYGCVFAGDKGEKYVVRW